MSRGVWGERGGTQAQREVPVTLFNHKTTN